MTYTHPDYLISTESLAAKLADDAACANLRIFDATVHLTPNPKGGYKAVAGREDFDKAHIPGAQFMDLMAALSDTESRFNFMMPSDEHLQEAYRALGISAGNEVVLYSTGHMMWATRAWWMLHSLGHDNVKVLDGGFAKWQAENRATTDDVAAIAPGTFTPKRNPERWADKQEVLAAIGDGGVCTINALSPGVYSGDAEMSYGRKGHITGSVNVYYDTILKDGCFRPAEEIREAFAASGALDRPRTIAYCGGGISATIDALALKLIGYEEVAVYDGSMGEWVADESLPMELGS